MKFDTIVRNGQVVTGAGTYRADIGIAGGIIQVVGSIPETAAADRVIDAAGKYVLPGLLDVHLHFQCYSHHVDTFEVALRSAAHGGITTVLAFLIPGAQIRKRPMEVIHEFRDLGQRQAVVDFGFHVHVPEAPGALDDIPAAVEAGVPSLKLFLAYKSIGRMASEDHLLSTMEKVADAGGILLLHAEDGEVIDRLIHQQIARGRVGSGDFLPTHPPEVEYLAVQKALNMAKVTGCPVYFLHLSTPRAVDMIMEARAAGQPVFAETCPQYLELTNDLLFDVGPLAKVGPPLRTPVETEGLWERLLTGRIDTIGSDHSSHTAETKRGGYQNIFDCWYGAPAVETMAPVMADALVRRGSDLTRLVRHMAENPARIFGLYPKKGTIRPGADADLVVWDPGKSVTIRADMQHCDAGYTLYEGRTVQGWPVMTLIRGQVVLEDGELKVSPGFGRFLARPRVDEAAIKAVANTLP